MRIERTSSHVLAWYIYVYIYSLGVEPSGPDRFIGLEESLFLIVLNLAVSIYVWLEKAPELKKVEHSHLQYLFSACTAFYLQIKFVIIEGFNFSGDSLIYPEFQSGFIVIFDLLAMFIAYNLKYGSKSDIAIFVDEEDSNEQIKELREVYRKITKYIYLYMLLYKLPFSIILIHDMLYDFIPDKPLLNILANVIFSAMLIYEFYTKFRPRWTSISSDSFKEKLQSLKEDNLPLTID